MDFEHDGPPLAPPVTPRVSARDSPAIEDWEEQFEALADAVVHTPEWKAACAAEEVRAKSPRTTPERPRSQARNLTDALAVASPVEISAALLEVEDHVDSTITESAAAVPVAKSGLEELTFVVEQLLKDDTCPWCAASTPAQMVTWMQSELTEVAEELFLASALNDGVPSSNGNGSSSSSSSTSSSNDNASTAAKYEKAITSSAAAEPTAQHNSALESEVGDVLFNVFLAAELCRRDGLQCSLDKACRAAAVKVRRRAPYAFPSAAQEGDNSGSRGRGDGGDGTRSGGGDNNHASVGDVASAEECWQNAKAAERSQKQRDENQPSKSDFGAAATAATAAAGGQSDGEASAALGDAVVLFAKWPIKGRAKTRLAKAPELGGDGAQQVALAMLKDAIVGLATCPALEKASKVVLFAPPDAGLRFLELLNKLGLPGHLEDNSASSPPPSLNAVRLVAMGTTAGAAATNANVTSVTDATGKDLTAPDLGMKLQQGLKSVRKLKTMRNNKSGKDETTSACFGAVAIQGMDSPELSPTAVAQALATSRRGGCAALTPATDGGYVLLVLPPAASTKVFAGVEWSTARTCYSQVSALSRVGISCRINLPPLADMDEPSDLHQLHRRLLLADTPSLLTTTFQGSESSSSTSNCGHFNGLSCPHTKELLHRIYGSEAQPDKTAKSFQDGENENNAHLNAAPPSSRPEIAATHYKISTSKSLMSWLMPVGIAMSATGVLLALWPKIAARKHS